MDLVENIKDFVSTSQELPSLPDIIIELNAMLASHDVNIDKLSKLLETDIAMSTNILTMANSVFYRGLKEVKSVKEGIMRIGLRETRNIVYAGGVIPLFTDIEAINPDNFWKHSIVTAYTAEILGEMIHYKKDISQLYICGLLHDMGVLVFAQFFGNEMKKVISSTIDENGNLNQGFLELFNSMHAEIGGMLLKRWDLPELLVQTALFHHLPDLSDEQYRKEIQIIKLANEVTIMEGFHYFSDLSVSTYPFSLQYNSKKVEKIRETVKSRLEEIEAVTKLLNR